MKMWSFVDNQGNPRWLWHIIDHGTGAVLAYVFGHHQDAVSSSVDPLRARDRNCDASVHSRETTRAVG